MACTEPEGMSFTGMTADTEVRPPGRFPRARRRTRRCALPALFHGHDGAHGHAPSRALSQGRDGAHGHAPSRALSQGQDGAHGHAPSRALSHGHDGAHGGAPSRRFSTGTTAHTEVRPPGAFPRAHWPSGRSALPPPRRTAVRIFTPGFIFSPSKRGVCSLCLQP